MYNHLPTWQIFVLDHFVFHWVPVVALMGFDLFLYYAGLWKKCKISSSQIPVTWSNILYTVLRNQLISIPIIYASVQSGFFNNPHNWYQVPRFLIAFMYTEILFYYIHRLLHTKMFYRFHRDHHKWSHPSAVAALYSHPVEHVLTNLLPAVIPGYLAGMSEITVRIWHILALTNAVIIAHGGYTLSCNTHDYHHQYIKYNYGVIGILDYVHGTNYSPYSSSSSNRKLPSSSVKDHIRSKDHLED